MRCVGSGRKAWRESVKDDMDELGMGIVQGYVERLHMGNRLTLAEHGRNKNILKIDDDDDGQIVSGFGVSHQQYADDARAAKHQGCKWGMQMIDGCSLKLCVATLSVASSGTTELSSIHDSFVMVLSGSIS